MAIQFQCPTCDAVVKVPDSAAGKIGRCPKCDKRVQIPNVAPPAAPPAAPTPAATAAAAPFVPPLPDFDAPPAAGPAPLLGDKSTVFVLPPANAAPIGPPMIGPPPEQVAPPPPPPPDPANPAAAREEYETGQAWLTKPFVPGAGWPPALRAVIHFTKAARLDPKNADYATHAGMAGCLSIDRFLESWGKGPLTSIAAFHIDQPLGQQIDNTEKLFRPSGLSEENLDLIRSQANDALHWFQEALKIDPEDAVTRCHRAQLLMNLGAFPLALADAKAVLSSPLVTSKSREAAQKVADFILEEDSPLRKYLTRAQAQHLPPPTGVELPKPAAKPAPAPPPPTTAEIPFAINTGGGAPAFSPGALAPTAAEEMPLLGAVPRAAAPPSSVSARLKQKKGAGWVGIAVPVVFGLLLVGAGLLYLQFTRVKFVGNLPGEDLGNTTLRKTMLASEFGLPEDKLQLLTSTFRDEPETLRTDLRTLTLRGSAQGIEVSIRPGEKSRMVRVDLRSDANLNAFCGAKEHAAALEAPLPKLRVETLRKFGSDFAASQSAGMRMGNLGEYLDTLGADLLVHGLGYHVVARTPERDYPCVFEDESGAVYFLLPPAVTTFEVVPRRFQDPPESDRDTVFGTDFKYTITIAPPAAPPPAPKPVPAAPSEPPAPAAEATATVPAPASGTETLPPNFFGESTN